MISPRAWRRLRSLGVTAGVAAALSCGGSRGHAIYDGSSYRDGPIAFALPDAPTSWKRVDVTDAVLAFRDDPHDGSILVNARCLRPDDDTPLPALTNHLLFGSTEREFVAQETEPFDHREAMHSHVRAKWDGVPMELDLFVMKKDGCIYDFVYMSPPPGFEGGTPEFERFVRGFHTLPGSGTAG